jgi:hypothetical protein
MFNQHLKQTTKSNTGSHRRRQPYTSGALCFADLAPFFAANAHPFLKKPLWGSCVFGNFVSAVSELHSKYLAAHVVTPQVASDRLRLRRPPSDLKLLGE